MGLKTLRDLKEECYNWNRENNFDRGAIEGMLKFYDLLRPEAIKWVKANNLDPSFDLGFEDWVSIEKWIKVFFNITEEELA